jgi:hypothetical protein
MGFKPSKADICVYVKKTKNETSFILVHVDDAWAGSTRKESLVKIRSAFGEEYLF